MQKEQVNIIWFRNDLRLRDSENIYKAVQSGKPIIGFYCFDERHFEVDSFGFKKTTKFRAKFLLETVNDLKEQLAEFNIPLFISKGKTEEELSQLTTKVNFDTIFCQDEWTSEELAIENKVLKCLPNVTIEKSHSQFLVQPKELSAIVTNIPNSFTSFRKKVEKYIDIRKEFVFDLTRINANFDFSSLEDNQMTLEILGFQDFKNDKGTAFPFKGGEQSGLNRLEDYLFTTQKVSYYKETRNGLVGVNYSTKFSSWLANGSLSPVSIYHEIKRYEKDIEANQSTYWVVFELLWRDFFKFISLKYNNAVFKSGGIQEKEINWLHNDEVIQQWINGETKCDFVNANMIELKETGWMSNRGRQNVASYFAKELFQDWRVGASYFESMLIDYDLHSNYGNWMYVSGVGNDGRNGKFNTQLQAKRYDENNQFRKLWLQTQLF